METALYGHLTKPELQQRYDEFAPVYWQEEFASRYLFGLGRLRGWLLGKATGKVLDVAGGTGSNLPYLSKASDITAVDLSAGMLSVARARAERLGLRAAFRVMDAEALDFPDGAFDTVVSSLSTCTFPDPISALREMRRVVRHDGRILLLEHGRSSWGVVARYQDRTAPQHYSAAGCRWNQEPLEIAREAGLAVVESRRHFAGVFHAIVARP